MTATKEDRMLESLAHEIDATIGKAYQMVEKAKQRVERGDLRGATKAKLAAKALDGMMKTIDQIPQKYIRGNFW